MSKPVILCVDDEPLILEALKTELRNRFGGRFSYESAQSGEEGLEFIEELALDGITVVLILSDWLMPGLRGDQFLAEVHTRWPQIQAVLVTGQADPGAVERVRASALASHVVFKPWKAEDLLRLVSELVPQPA